MLSSFLSKHLLDNKLNTNYKNLKMRLTIIIISLFLSITLSGQDCDCTVNLGEIMEFTELNYSLISFKVTEENKNIYEAHKATLLERAKHKNWEDCQYLIKAYTEFFNDGHLWVDKVEQSSPKKEIKYKELTDIDSLKIMTLLTSDKSDPIEGIWESNSYTIGIVKNQNKKRDRDFVGIILQSSNPNFKKGEVKMEIKKNDQAYTANYLMGNHSVEVLKTEIFEDYHIKQGLSTYWRKLYPMPKGQVAKQIGEINPQGVVFKDLGDNNYYIKIGSFGSHNRSAVENIVNEHGEKLKKSNILIVDVRDNGGGSDYTYSPLQPYIFSGTIQMTDFGVWVSPGNKDYFSDWLEASDTLNNTPFFQAMQSEIPQLVTWPDEDMTLTLDTIYDHPTKVAIIANNESASSAETFVERCRQSKRVVTFGQNTNGCVDGFNGNKYATECYSIRYPTSLKTIHPEKDAIDPFGILPDVYLSEEMKDPIKYIVEYMNNYKQ